MRNLRLACSGYSAFCGVGKVGDSVAEHWEFVNGLMRDSVPLLYLSKSFRVVLKELY